MKKCYKKLFFNASKCGRGCTAQTNSKRWLHYIEWRTNVNATSVVHQRSICTTPRNYYYSQFNTNAHSVNCISNNTKGERVNNSKHDTYTDRKEVLKSANYFTTNTKVQSHNCGELMHAQGINKLSILLCHTNSESIWSIKRFHDYQQQSTQWNAQSALKEMIDEIEYFSANTSELTYYDSSSVDHFTETFERICEIITLLTYQLRRHIHLSETFQERNIGMSLREKHALKRIQGKLRCSYSLLMFSITKMTLVKSSTVVNETLHNTHKCEEQQHFNATSMRECNEESRPFQKEELLEVLSEDKKGKTKTSTAAMTTTIKYLPEIMRTSNVTKENVEDNYLVAVHSDNEESKKDENFNGSDSTHTLYSKVFSVFPHGRSKEHVCTMVPKVKKDIVEKVSRLVETSQRVMEITREQEFQAELPTVQEYEELLQIVNGAMYLFGCLHGMAVLEQISLRALCTLVTLYARCKEGASSDIVKSKEHYNYNEEAKWDRESHNVLFSYFSQLFMCKKVDEETKNVYDKLSASMLQITMTALQNDKEMLDLLAQEVQRRLRRCTLMREIQLDNDDDVSSAAENAKLHLLSLRDRKAAMLARNCDHREHGMKLNNVNKNCEKVVQSTLRQGVTVENNNERQNEEEQQMCEFTLNEIDEMCTSFAFLRYRNKELWTVMRDATCAHIHRFNAESNHNTHEHKSNKQNGCNEKNHNSNDDDEVIQTYIKEEMMCCIRHILYSFDFVGEFGCYDKVMKMLVSVGLIDHAIEPPSITTRAMREMCYNSYKEQTTSKTMTIAKAATCTHRRRNKKRHLENNSWLDDAQRCILSTLFIPGFPWYTVQCNEEGKYNIYNCDHMSNNDNDINTGKRNNKVNSESFAVMRYVIPYDYTMKVFVKGRWVNQTLLSVYSTEFAHHPISFYEACIQNGRLRCVPKQRLQHIMLESINNKRNRMQNNNRQTDSYCHHNDHDVNNSKHINVSKCCYSSETECVVRQHNIKRRNVKRQWHESMETFAESIPVEQEQIQIANSITQHGNSRHCNNSDDKCCEGTRNECGGVDTTTSSNNINDTTIKCSASNQNTVLHHDDVVLHTIHRHEIPIPLCSCVIDNIHISHKEAIKSNQINNVNCRALINICSVQIKQFGVIVISKPAGIPTHATGRYFYNSLLNMLEYVLAPKRLEYWLFGNAVGLCKGKLKEKEGHEEELYGVMRKRCREELHEQQEEENKCVTDVTSVNESQKLQNSTETSELNDAQVQCIHVLLQSLVSTSNLSNAELIELYEYYCPSQVNIDISNSAMESIPLDKTPRPCYRLDRVTSGVVICAVSRSANCSVSKLLMYKSLHAEQFFRSLLTDSGICTNENKLANENTVQSNSCNHTCLSSRVINGNDKRSITYESKTKSDVNKFFINFSNEYNVCKRYLAKVQGDFNISMAKERARETEQASEHLQLHLISLSSNVLENVNSTCDNALMQEKLLQGHCYSDDDYENDKHSLKKEIDVNANICKYESDHKVTYPNGLLVCTEQSIIGPENNNNTDKNINTSVEQQTSDKTTADNKWEKNKTIWSITLIQKLYTLQTSNISSSSSSSESSCCLVKNNEVSNRYVSSVLLCTPLTGRLHQIRLHLQQIGYPIVGDTIYGYCKQNESNENFASNKCGSSAKEKNSDNHTEASNIHITNSTERSSDNCKCNIYFNENELPTHYKEKWWNSFAGTSSNCTSEWELPSSSTDTHTTTSELTPLVDDDVVKCRKYKNNNGTAKSEDTNYTNGCVNSSVINNQIDDVLCYECAHKLPVASFTDNCSCIALHAECYSMKTSALRSNTMLENTLKNSDQGTGDDWIHFTSLTLPQWVHK